VSPVQKWLTALARVGCKQKSKLPVTVCNHTVGLFANSAAKEWILCTSTDSEAHSLLVECPNLEKFIKTN